MAIPETITPPAVARRAGQHAFATLVAAALKDRGIQMVDWWVDRTGGVNLKVRLDGGAERIFEFTAIPAQQPTVLAQVIARLDLMEAHV